MSQIPRCSNNHQNHSTLLMGWFPNPLQILARDKNHFIFARDWPVLGLIPGHAKSCCLPQTAVPWSTVGRWFSTLLCSGWGGQFDSNGLVKEQMHLSDLLKHKCSITWESQKARKSSWRFFLKKSTPRSKRPGSLMPRAWQTWPNPWPNWTCPTMSCWMPWYRTREKKTTVFEH